MPPPLLRFVELFNRGEHWASHEALEGPWREGRSRFYHGLILFASAYVHHERGNLHGVDAQMRKALDALQDLPRSYLGIDLDEVRKRAAHARRVAGEARGGRAGATRTTRTGRPPWTSRIRPPHLEVNPDRVRGDEPEADGIRRSRS